jgi:hypothetical protein
MKQSRREPPHGAPAGTVWFGGPVDRCRVTLRIFGDDLVPDEITELLGQSPTRSEGKGSPLRNSYGEVVRLARTGSWHLEHECGEMDVEEAILALLGRLQVDPGVWHLLGHRYQIDLFCGLFLETTNRGFSLSAETCRALADRGLEIGFDIYCPGVTPLAPDRAAP